MTGDDAERWAQLFQLFAAARENCAKHYDDLFRTFMSLDSKAQSTATIAGVQLAAIVAFLQKGQIETLLRSYGAVAGAFLMTAVVLLVVVIGACVVAMWVTNVPAPYGADREAEALRSLRQLSPSEFSGETAVNHLAEHLEHWQKLVQEMSEATARKAKRVAACQGVMVLGLAAASTVFLLLLVASWW